MDPLYEHLSFSPELLRPYIAALLIIIIGYFVSKIFAAIILSIFPKNTSNKEALDSKAPFRIRIARVFFWVTWLIFVFIGTNQVSRIPYNLLKQSLTLDSLMGSLSAIIGVCAFLIGEKYIVQLFKSLRDFINSIAKPKNSFFFKLVKQYGWIPFFIICFITLLSPGTLGYKVTVTMLVLFSGLLISKIAKEATSSSINIFGSKNHLPAKFVQYFIFIHFLFATSKVWL